MNREQHLKLLEEKMAKNLDIARRKNNDYCGVGVEVDPFKNFRISEQAGVPVEKGILVRMYDKMSRISALLSQDAQVNDESIQDTLADLSNYSLILSNYLDSKKTPTLEQVKAFVPNRRCPEDEDSDNSDLFFKPGDLVKIKVSKNGAPKEFDGQFGKLVYVEGNNVGVRFECESIWHYNLNEIEAV